MSDFDIIETSVKKKIVKMQSSKNKMCSLHLCPPQLSPYNAVWPESQYGSSDCVMESGQHCLLRQLTEYTERQFHLQSYTFRLEDGFPLVFPVSKLT